MMYISKEIFAALIVFQSLFVAWSAPLEAGDIEQEATELSFVKRPKYMDTRRDLDIFKDLVLLSIQELVKDNSLSATILPAEELTKPMKKRARYMGICMRKQFNSFIPFPCLRNENYNTPLKNI